MKALPIFRAAHMEPYKGFLQQLGVPLESRLVHAGLPSQLPEKPGAYLPLMQVTNFLADASRSEGIDDLGLRVSERMTVGDMDSRYLATLVMTPTLLAALETFFRFGKAENNALELFMLSNDSTAKLCTTLDFDALPEQRRISEWTQNMALISIVRQFAGDAWFPKSIAFSTSTPICHYARELFPNTRFYTGQQSSWVEIPKRLLALQLPGGFPGQATGLENQETSQHALNLGSSLCKIIESYLVDGAPTIQQAAEICGTSVRTLQRRLRESGSSYKNLLENARFNTSAELLKQPDIKLIDIAYSLGYEDPSHFSRAFRRITGMSPREFRQQQTGG